MKVNIGIRYGHESVKYIDQITVNGWYALLKIQFVFIVSFKSYMARIEEKLSFVIL